MAIDSSRRFPSVLTKLQRLGHSSQAARYEGCTVPRGEPEPEADEALLSRCRQLARDLDDAGGVLHARRLSSGDAARGLCAARPGWFRLLEDRGVLWGVELLDAGRRDLIGGG